MRDWELEELVTHTRRDLHRLSKIEREATGSFSRVASLGTFSARAANQVEEAHRTEKKDQKAQSDGQSRWWREGAPFCPSYNIPNICSFLSMYNTNIFLFHEKIVSAPIYLREIYSEAASTGQNATQLRKPSDRGKTVDRKSVV